MIIHSLATVAFQLSSFNWRILLCGFLLGICSLSIAELLLSNKLTELWLFYDVRCGMWLLTREKVPIQDHILDAVWEFTNFSTWHVIPDILEKLIKKFLARSANFFFRVILFTYPIGHSFCTHHSIKCHHIPSTKCHPITRQFPTIEIC